MKKQKLLFILFFILVSIPVFSQHRAIQFTETSWAEIKAKALKEHKPIFMDAYASWCGPCKWLAANVFTNDTVADYFNSTFVNAHFDMEKGEGLELQKLYNVYVYPTLLFMDANGDLIHRGVGSMPVAEFVSLGKRAVDPGNNLASYNKRFAAGSRDADFMYSYLDLNRYDDVFCKKVTGDYFSKISIDDLLQRPNWLIIREFVNDVESREFKYLVKNQEVFAGKYGKDTVTQKIKETYLAGFKKLIKEKPFNREAYDGLKLKVTNSGYSQPQEIIALADISYYKKIKSWDKYAQAAGEYFSFDNKNTGLLNDVAWTIFENVEDKGIVAQAIGWAKRAVELSPVAGIMDTYANLLYKSGNKAEAIKVESQAIETAKTAGEPFDELEATLKSMKEK